MPSQLSLDSPGMLLGYSPLGQLFSVENPWDLLSGDPAVSLGYAT